MASASGSAPVSEYSDSSASPSALLLFLASLSCLLASITGGLTGFGLGILFQLAWNLFSRINIQGTGDLKVSLAILNLISPATTGPNLYYAFKEKSIVWDVALGLMPLSSAGVVLGNFMLQAFNPILLERCLGLIFLMFAMYQLGRRIHQNIFFSPKPKPNDPPLNINIPSPNLYESSNKAKAFEANDEEAHIPFEVESKLKLESTQSELELEATFVSNHDHSKLNYNLDNLNNLDKLESLKDKNNRGSFSNEYSPAILEDKRKPKTSSSVVGLYSANSDTFPTSLHYSFQSSALDDGDNKNIKISSCSSESHNQDNRDTNCETGDIGDQVIHSNIVNSTDAVDFSDIQICITPIDSKLEIMKKYFAYFSKLFIRWFRNWIAQRRVQGALLTGAAAGILSGLFGTSGPPVMLYFSIINLTGSQIRSTFSVLSMVQIIVNDISALSFGLFKLSDWSLYTVCFLSTIAGTLIGNKLHHKADTDTILIILQLLVFVATIPLTGAGDGSDFGIVMVWIYVILIFILVLSICFILYRRYKYWLSADSSNKSKGFISFLLKDNRKSQSTNLIMNELHKPTSKGYDSSKAPT